MQKATLGGVQGAANLHCRQQSSAENEWRGIFFFPKEAESAIADLVKGRRTVIYEALFQGRPGRLNVTLTSLSPEGSVYFEGVGEPY
jgi:hypothetical protein